MNKTMTMDQAQELLSKEQYLVLLDVIMPDEYAQGHIKGSINIPLNQVPAIGAKYPDKNTRFLVYCQSGGRSAKACAFLEKLGYPNASNIGGFPSWKGEVE